MNIPQTILDQLMDQARAEAPLEGCGYLAGDGETVVKHYPLTNVDASAEHFTLDPKEQFATVKAARAEGLKLLAVYHSHPATPARPSAEDIRLAFDPSVLYVVVTLVPDENTVRGFWIRDNVVSEEEIVITEKAVGLPGKQQEEY